MSLDFPSSNLSAVLYQVCDPCKFHNLCASTSSSMNQGNNVIHFMASPYLNVKRLEFLMQRRDLLKQDRKGQGSKTVNQQYATYDGVVSETLSGCDI